MGFSDFPNLDPKSQGYLWSRFGAELGPSLLTSPGVTLTVQDSWLGWEFWGEGWSIQMTIETIGLLQPGKTLLDFFFSFYIDSHP